MKKIIFNSLLLFLLASCGESLMSYDITTETPVVESFLQEGTNEFTVKLYSMEVYLKEDFDLSKPIGGLQLKVNGQNLQETASGTYSLNLGEDIIQGGQNYDLSFEYLGKTISASTSVPKPMSNLRIEATYITRSSTGYYWGTTDTTEIKLTWDDPDRSYYQIYIESPATTDMPTMGGGMVFRRRMMQPFQGNSYTTSSRDFPSTGDYGIYVYRVNKDYVDLYERVSSTDMSNPSSALENAFGIFTAMSVSRIRFQVIAEEE